MPKNVNDVALSELRRDLGACLLSSEEDIFSSSFDGLKIERRPSAVIKPERAEQVGRALALANEHSVPVTTRGVGSSLTGGATPLAGGWVLDVSGLDAIDVDAGNTLVRCGPGAVVADLQKKAFDMGLF